MPSTRRITAALIIAASLAAPAAAKLTLEIDYSQDTSTFFSTSTANGLKARAALARAADTFSDRLLDNFTAINNTGGTWTPRMFSVSTGAYGDVSGLTTVNANVLKVYAGGRVLAGSTLGQGGPGGYSAGGTQTYLNNVKSRGQAGALLAAPTDFASWGGSIVFDSEANRVWNYDHTLAPVAGQADLLSVALHELGHLLGIGTADSFTVTLNSGGNFTGAKAKALNNGVNVPLSPNQDHLAQSVTSTVSGADSQEASMTPSITSGSRKLFTRMDWAVLDDLGYDLAKPGDANADANVNFDDLLLVAQNYGTTTGMTWSEGDFNYDNACNFDDLLGLAQNYGSSGPLALTGFSESFAADWAMAQSMVPEPMTVAVIALATMPMRRRREC